MPNQTQQQPGQLQQQLIDAVTCEGEGWKGSEKVLKWA